MSLRFDADVYTRAEADQLLRSHGISLDGILDHFGLRTTYKSVILGAELRAIFEAASEKIASQVRSRSQGRKVSVQDSARTNIATETRKGKNAVKKELVLFTNAERTAILKGNS